MADQKSDPELGAIATLLAALEPLDPTARQNVIEYVFKRLKISADTPNVPEVATPHHVAAAPAKSPGPVTSPTAHASDIRSFTEQKRPKSASEMAAVVGYYLAHLAPSGDRRDYLTANDVTKYFSQANFPLPGSSPMTLVHAKNAGYLDAQARGRYRLNPVGHNLVVHRLPATEARPSTHRAPAKRSARRKSTGRPRAKR